MYFVIKIIVNICNKYIFLNVSKVDTREQTQHTDTNMSTNTNNGKLKVLVFDDTEVHRKSAKILLADDYDLTVVGTYDEARKALVSYVDYDLAKKLFANKYSGNPYDHCDDRDERIKYYYDQCEKPATVHPEFDIVLTDLLVPASSAEQGDKGSKFVGQEMPLGTTIALQALIIGIKMVAVVTDINHHHHPASAAFDCLKGVTCKLQGVNIICTNNAGSVVLDATTHELVSEHFMATKEGMVKYPLRCENRPWEGRIGITHGKDWKRVLLSLTGEGGDLE